MAKPSLYQQAYDFISERFDDVEGEEEADNLASELAVEFAKSKNISVESEEFITTIMSAAYKVAGEECPSGDDNE